LARNGVRFQSEICLPKYHRGTAVGVLSGVVRLIEFNHTEPQPAESMQGKPKDGRRRLSRIGKQEHVVLRQSRSPSAAAGRRHAHLANDDSEQHTVYTGHIHRIVERSKQKTKTVYARPSYR